MYKCNIEARSRSKYCCEKAISITFSECVSVALVISHAKRRQTDGQTDEANSHFS
jgi:hypothetical protein